MALPLPPLTLHRLRREQLVPRPLEEVFSFFSEPRNLERLTPPSLQFSVLTPSVTLARGTTIDYRLRLHGLPIRWRTLIEVWEPPHRFLDLQLQGPYRLWSHLHEFVPTDGGTLIRDDVVYALPLGPLGEMAHRILVERDVEEIFAFRRTAIERLFPAKLPSS